MEVTDAGMVIEMSAVDWNALFPMEVTDAGMVIEVSAVDWNAEFEMLVHPVESLFVNTAYGGLPAFV